MTDLLWYKVKVGLKGEGYAERSIVIAASSPEKAQELALEHYVKMIVVSEPICVDIKETLLDIVTSLPDPSTLE